MIKKTIKTLKDNPKILLLFAIPFLYTLVRMILIRSSILSDIRLTEFIQSQGLYSEPNMYVTWGIGIIYYVGWGIFLYPPILYLIYESVDNKQSEDWYKRGLKGYWWRNLVLSLLFFAVIVAVMLPLFFVLSIVIGFTIAFSNSLVIFYIVITVFAVIVLSITVFMHIGTAAVFAEKNFGKGLGNMFKVGFKYFFKVLPVAIVIMIPMGLVVGNMIANSVREVSDIVTITLSLWGVVTGAFVSTFCMHCYVNEKNKRLANLGSNQQVSSNQIPTEMDDKPNT